jgi:uncharacterized RDD family membrane protein YckC
MLHCVTETPAGWYPDPDPAAAGGSLRYWDGTAWTSHIHAAAPAKPVGPTTPDGEPLAGWWWRVLAYMIDGIIVSVASGIISLPAQIQVQRDLRPTLDEFNRDVAQDPESVDIGALFSAYADVMQDRALWLAGPSVVLTLLFWVGFLRWKGATPGKLLLGMSVRLREEPGTLSWPTVIARTAVQFGVTWTLFGLSYATGSATWLVFATVATVVWLIDPLWAAWDPDRQTLHDKVARTNVVRRA